MYKKKKQCVESVTLLQRSVQTGRRGLSGMSQFSELIISPRVDDQVQDDLLLDVI